MADQDFKYIIQDLTNIYLGARSTYEELMEDENVPHKLKEIIVRVMLTEVAPDTTPENHVFYMEKESASFKAVSYTHLDVYKRQPFFLFLFL